jgi:cytoskeletal protein RodZ
MSSFGEELRRERELREFTLREVSESTKISLRHLEALERNDFEQLPGGVFNRGFVRAYAQFIGVDPEAMVNAYLLEEQARSSEGGSHERYLRRRSAPQRQPAAAEEHDTPSTRRHWGRPILFVGLVVAVVAAAVAGWWFLARS